MMHLDLYYNINIYFRHLYLGGYPLKNLEIKLNISCYLTVLIKNKNVAGD